MILRFFFKLKKKTMDGITNELPYKGLRMINQMPYINTHCKIGNGYKFVTENNIVEFVYNQVEYYSINNRDIRDFKNIYEVKYILVEQGVIDMIVYAIIGIEIQPIILIEFLENMVLMQIGQKEIEMVKEIKTYEIPKIDEIIITSREMKEDIKYELQNSKRNEEYQKILGNYLDDIKNSKGEPWLMLKQFFKDLGNDIGDLNGIDFLVNDFIKINIRHNGNYTIVYNENVIPHKEVKLVEGYIKKTLKGLDLILLGTFKTRIIISFEVNLRKSNTELYASFIIENSDLGKGKITNISKIENPIKRNIYKEKTFLYGNNDIKDVY